MQISFYYSIRFIFFFTFAYVKTQFYACYSVLILKYANTHCRECLVDGKICQRKQNIWSQITRSGSKMMFFPLWLAWKENNEISPRRFLYKPFHKGEIELFDWRTWAIRLVIVLLLFCYLLLRYVDDSCLRNKKKHSIQDYILASLIWAIFLINVYIKKIKARYFK